MTNKKYVIQYKTETALIKTGDLHTDYYDVEETETDSMIKVSLKHKKDFELVSFRIEYDHPFDEKDRFFANGYNCWTTTRELKKEDILKGVTPLAYISKKTRDLATIASDERFIKYTRKPGEFHSHTYTYIRNGNKLLLYGSLSEKHGFTYFQVKMNENYFAVCKDVEGKKVTEDYLIFDIVKFEGGYDEVFDNYFGAINAPKPRIDHMSGYTSWYNYFQNINEDIIIRDLNGMDRAKDSVSIFQIDDGYETYVGDWLDPNPSKFPKGMKYIADEIHGKGYQAGIWLAPFSCQKVSRTANKHPEWLIKGNDGKPLLGVFAWHGAYTLDIYHEGAREYIRHFFDVILNEWGFDMVKLDFLYSQCMLPRNGKTRGEIMYDALVFLRECVGDKLFLGCGVPLGSAFGIVDACRISCDVDLKYSGKYYNKLGVGNELPSAQNAITSTIFRRHLDGRIFVNDPDVFFLRENNLDFTNEQKMLLAQINNLCGNVLFVSDNAGDYDDKTVSLLKKFFKKSEAKITSAEYITKDVIRIKLIENEVKKSLTFNIKTGKILTR